MSFPDQAEPAPVETPRAGIERADTVRSELDRLGRSEWLLTNGLGGFAMGTASGIPERRYHGWLVAATMPPLGRVVALHSCVEWLVETGAGSAGDDPGAASSEFRHDLSAYRFADGTIAPRGLAAFERFELDGDACHWRFAIPGRDGARAFSVTRSLLLLDGANALRVRYLVECGGRTARLELRPLAALRDFHALLREGADLAVALSERGVVSLSGGESALLLRAQREASSGSAAGAEQSPGIDRPSGHGVATDSNPLFTADHQWWRRFEYQLDRERGQDAVEDLFSPGIFRVGCTGTTVITLDAWVCASPRDGAPGPSSASGTSGDPGACGFAIRSDAFPAPDESWAETEAAVRRRRLARSGAQRVAEAIARAPSRAIDLEAARAVLVRAADQFVVLRERRAGTSGAPPAPSPAELDGASPRSAARLTDRSIIAGYPWFSDWGRDTFIALRGVLLCTGRFAEALAVLRQFAGLQRRGLIPNCFDDRTGSAEYNTVDGSLWFVHAACEYLRTSGDREGFASIRGAALAVVDAYRDGTDFDIRMDDDGLIAAGSPGTQLTWMDARRDGVVFTPRHGKPVEINALWHSGLIELAEAIAPEGQAPSEAAMAARARELRALAARAQASFEPTFWNAEADCLFDVILPGGPAASDAGAGGRAGGTPSRQIRPNQIFAVSQPHSPLSPARRAAVVACVRSRLLTPVGLRTLDPADPGYRPRYEGSLFDRDGAYHNGTVWPWLIGAYGEALLRVGEFSPEARAEAAAALAPLLQELTGPRRSAGPLLQGAEIYDAEPIDGAWRPQGCPAQAWSIGEALRLLRLIVEPASR